MSGDAKNWCYTLFDYDFETFDMFQQLLDEGKADRVCYQEEKCPNSINTHIQGYIGFSKRRTFKNVKLLLGNTAHIEVAKGTPYENFVYCTKISSSTGRYKFQSGLFTEPTQGKRSDIAEAAEAIAAGRNIGELAISHPTIVIKFNKGLERLCELQPYKRRTNLTVVVITGPTGIGKTRFVHDYAEAQELTIYPKDLNSNNNYWFDGYEKKDILLLDDFHDNQVDIHTLKHWLDIYSFNIQRKGSYTIPNWNLVFITSNTKTQEWYPRATCEDRAAIQRRIHHDYFFDTEHSLVQELKEYVTQDKQFTKTNIISHKGDKSIEEHKQEY